MSVCVTCGEEFEEDDKYCPHCGSPTDIKLESEAVIRPGVSGYRAGMRGRNLVLLFVFLFLLGLLFLTIYVTRTLSVQLSVFSSGIY